MAYRNCPSLPHLFRDRELSFYNVLTCTDTCCSKHLLDHVSNIENGYSDCTTSEIFMCRVINFLVHKDDRTMKFIEFLRTYIALEKIRFKKGVKQRYCYQSLHEK